MKVKVLTGKSFGGIMKYTNKKDSEFISSSTGKDPVDFLRQCARLRESRPDCQVPVLHFPLSLPPGEKLNQQNWAEAVSRFQNEMGLEGHDFFTKRHTDTDHDHIHLMISKIHPDGHLWKDSNSARRAMAACEKIEKEMGLTITKTLQEFRDETGKRRHHLKDKEVKMMERTGSTGSKRKDAITKKIAEKRKLENEKRRALEQNGNPNQRGIEQQRLDSKFIHGDEKRDLGTKKQNLKIGEIKSSRSRDGALVHFKRDGEIIAKMSQDKIEIMALDADSIKFGIEQAVKSGKVPLEFFGTKEFKELAEKVADDLGIPVKSENLESIMKKLSEDTQKAAEKSREDAASTAHRALMSQPLPTPSTHRPDAPKMR